MKARIQFPLILVIFTSPLWSAGSPSGGLTLLEAPSARAVGLGESFSAIQDDVTAIQYNPSTLQSLKSFQANFLYQKGLNEDAFGQITLGKPFKNFSLAISAGYYDAGTLFVNDGISAQEVDVQKDMVGGLTLAKKTYYFDVGATGKYLRSELGGEDSASAVAADAGVNWQLFPDLRVGFSFLNMGTQLKFNEVGDELPRTFRFGVSQNLFPDSFKTILVADGAYLLEDEDFQPSVGVETRVGPLALRGGYKWGSELRDLSFGSGFYLGRASIDYAFSLVDDLNSQHHISVGFRFKNKDERYK